MTYIGQRGVGYFFAEKLMLHICESKKRFHWQKGARNDRNIINQFNVEVTNMLPILAQDTITPASFAEQLLLEKSGMEDAFTFQAKLETIENTTYEFNAKVQQGHPQMAQEARPHASFGEKLLLQKYETKKLLDCQYAAKNDKKRNQQVYRRGYNDVTHERHRTQRFLLPLWRYSCSINARGRNPFSVRMELETIETKSTKLTSRLQRCDPKIAKETTSHASFGEKLLLHKGEKQKLLHFQNKVSKDREHNLRNKCRSYKHMTEKWHRRQRLLLLMGKYYCSIKARSRNSFTVSKELKMIGTKSTHLTSRLQRCDPKMAKKTTSHASFGEILLLHKSEKQKLLHFQNKVRRDRDRKLRVQCRVYKHVTH